MQSISHERCDTMEFWEDSTDRLATRFYILIFKVFSFLRRFEVDLVSCVNIISTVPDDRSKFSRFPENLWVVSFILYADNVFSIAAYDYVIKYGVRVQFPKPYTGPNFQPSIFPFFFSLSFKSLSLQKIQQNNKGNIINITVKFRK